MDDPHLATPRQLAYLRALGATDLQGIRKAEASQLIDELKRKRKPIRLGKVPATSATGPPSKRPVVFCARCGRATLGSPGAICGECQAAPTSHVPERQPEEPTVPVRRNLPLKVAPDQSLSRVSGTHQAIGN